MSVKYEDNKTGKGKFVMRMGSFYQWQLCGRFVLQDSKTSINIQVSDLIGGCGAVFLSGFTGHFAKEELWKKLLEFAIPYCQRAGAGMICFQAGQFYHKHNFVTAAEVLGFNFIEYPNYKHGGKDRQRFYTLTL